MRAFRVTPVDNGLKDQLQQKIDTKTKPLGALGSIEATALKLGLIQQTLTPVLKKPAAVVFAADHGITEEPVSAYPREVTTQMVLNFLSGGAAINVFARQHEMKLLVVNAGILGELPKSKTLIDVPVAKGTRNYLKEPAMSKQQCNQALERGAEVITGLAKQGTNVVCLGEMGIGNTSSASLIMSSLCKIPLEECVGRGTGLNTPALKKKIEVLKQAQTTHSTSDDPLEVLATYGGFEIAMLAGAYLRAAELGMVIVVDGFIATAALLVAQSLHAEVLDYCIFSHASDERGHIRLLAYLEVEPLLKLRMRLGEGSGAALAYPLLYSSALFLNEMASFESANVSEKN